MTMLSGSSASDTDRSIIRLGPTPNMREIVKIRLSAHRLGAKAVSGLVQGMIQNDSVWNRILCLLEELPTRQLAHHEKKVVRLLQRQPTARDGLCSGERFSRGAPKRGIATLTQAGFGCVGLWPSHISAVMIDRLVNKSASTLFALQGRIIHCSLVT